MTTVDMLSWVRQQIEARKALAETVRIGEGEWRYGHVGFKPGGVPRYALGLGNRVVDVGEPDDALTRDEARYLDVNDPRQIIADCEADIGILDDHDGSHECAHVTDNCLWILDGDCPTVRRIAARYQHRPGYRPEWAPKERYP